MNCCRFLQVGTFSVPLRGLLRQGQEVAEAVYECEVFDQAQIAQREGEPATLASAPLCGSLFVRLVNRGRSSGLAAMEPPGEALAAAPAGRRGQQGAAAVVVRAQPALDEAGEIAHDLAGAELVSACKTWGPSSLGGQVFMCMLQTWWQLHMKGAGG